MSTPTQPTDPYVFEGGFPTPETIQRAYDEADLNRAVQTFRFFYPSVSMMAIWKGNLAGGVAPNQVFAVLEGTPRQLVFTPNSDTPYSGLLVDLSAGPMVVELPPGLLMGTANDLNQRWVLDLGLPGPDKGKGGKHLLFPPGWDGQVPEGYAATATTNRVLVMVRAMPQGGDMAAATELMKSVKATRSVAWCSASIWSAPDGPGRRQVHGEPGLARAAVTAGLGVAPTRPCFILGVHAPGVHATLGVLPCRTAQPARLRAQVQRSPERAPESVRRQPERWSGPAPGWRWAPALGFAGG
jgi:hypothetical protein